LLIQSDKVFSYNSADFPPIVAMQQATYHGTIFSPNRKPKHLEVHMIRIFPATWTALHVSLISAATWLLVETDALNGMAPMFFH
jgi:hypothetical protein